MALQILHPGDVVRARGRTWHVTDVHSFDTCAQVKLTDSRPSAGLSCELLAPFDRIERIVAPSQSLRRVGCARWRRAARALIARSAGGLLQHSAIADIDILPHQLEPVVSVLRGEGSRVLIADDVGLGKTIEACLLIVELRARGLADRVLILTPPGLRDQWKEELSRRFHLDAAIVDARSLRRRVGEIPPDINPWSTWPTAIVSVDFAKRPDVLRATLQCRWDVVIVDEAHRVANDGDRRDAAAALTSRAGYVVLLTATPHSGDEAAFQSLCALGRQHDGLLIFRRTRRAIAGAVERRVHRLHVRASADERRMHARLDAFARAVQSERGDADGDMWIALALLRKRAFSSARALHLSVTRRLDVLAGASPAAAQLLLPLDEDGELIDADKPPDWHDALRLEDVNRERRLLSALAAAAAHCTAHESKIAAIRRLTRRLREPIIIFTEYRDTLHHVALSIGEPSALLHGAMPAADRRAALDAFASGRRRILLATDAAAEGLNLHRSCRAVINLELPWNPMRLEQRIGRVDRIGQARTVHAFHLVGRDTGELSLLDELRRRIAQAQSAIGAPDPLDDAVPAGLPPLASNSADVEEELRQLRLIRSLRATSADETRPLVTTARNRHTRARLRGRELALWECVIEDGRERPVASRLVAVAHDSSHGVGTANTELMQAGASDWNAHASRDIGALGKTAIKRCSEIINTIAGERLSAVQPGLFDRRTQFAHAALHAAHRSALSAQHERLAALQLASRIAMRPPALRLVLLSPP